MNRPFLAKCREAVYDEEQGMLVLLCFFQEFGESRIVCFPKSDFHYKYPSNSVPHIEMHRTAEMWKGKPFNIVIDNDPNRSHEAEEDPVALGKDFRDRIAKHLEEVSEGLSDSGKRIARRLGEVIERDQRSRSISDLLSDEMVIRSRLKNVDF
ncbi:hypothetical protein LCGC14_2847330 [marine sediment metagenome]|uniref:Uncharacterized protein n=1 Tax=marine sediment metagenome TaxID=412755 RepID=A0A0F9B0G3_9ZZZZ